MIYAESKKASRNVHRAFERIQHYPPMRCVQACSNESSHAKSRGLSGRVDDYVPAARGFGGGLECAHACEREREKQQHGSTS